MQKRNKVFFIISLVFAVHIPVSVPLTASLLADFFRLQATPGEDMGAIGTAGALIVIAALLVGLLLFLAVTSVAGGIFAALNLRAEVRWLRMVSLVLLIVFALVLCFAVGAFVALKTGPAPTES